MSLRTAVFFLIAAATLTTGGCKVNQGNGEAQPENTGKGYSPDNERNNVRNGKSDGANHTTPTGPGADQTPSQPASKLDRAR